MDKEKNLVSVVVTTHNRAEYLEQALDSLMGQDYEPLEIVVVDDGSTDHTREVAAQYADRVSYVFQANRGVGAAYNTGLKQSKGALVSFLDSDDLWTPNRLKKQVSYLKAHPETAIVTGMVKNFFDEGFPEEEKSKFGYMDTLLQGHVVSAMLVRREVFDTVDPFDESLKVGSMMDLLIRVKESGVKIDLLPDLVLMRRVHEGNNNRQTADSFLWRAKILKSHIDRRRDAANK